MKKSQVFFAFIIDFLKTLLYYVIDFLKRRFLK